MVYRYHITTTPDLQEWGVMDRYWADYCALPDKETGELRMLRWRSREAAEAWMFKCRQLWQVWEDRMLSTKEHYPPAGWRPAPPEISPWTRL